MIVLVAFRKELALMVFIGEGLHDTDTADIFFNTGIEVTDTAIERMPCCCHAAAIAQRHIGAKRHNHSRY
ncbi:hypothetical protein D3C87_2092290 [compost metagenome]